MAGTYDRPEMGNAPSRQELETRHDSKLKDQRKTEQKRREAYKLADIRDGRCCRACGTKHTQEHHHIRGRQIRNAEDSGNVMCICKSCHDRRHVKRTLVITGNADQQLCFELDGRVWHG
jgi:hypothetical protein